LSRISRPFNRFNPDREVSKLLTFKEPLVLVHSLKYVAGGVWPWPYDSLSPLRRKEPIRDPFVWQADAVERLLEHDDVEVRRKTAAVFGHLAGENAVPRMRQLLDDEDEEMRAIAIGVLARHHDSESKDIIEHTVAGIKDGFVACKVIEALREWGDDGIVPALIRFLQNDEYAGNSGKDVCIPALRAQTALKQLVGHVFPLDVATSLKIWEQAKAIEDPECREDYLQSILPSDRVVLVAKASTDNGRVFVTVTNRSQHSIILAKEPTWIDWRSETDGAGCFFNSGAFQVTGGDSFVVLAVGEAVCFDAAISRTFLLEFLISDLDKAKGVLFYTRNGNEFGINAWIGLVDVTFAQ